MNITITVHKVFSTGDSPEISLAAGSTVGDAAARVGAPTGSVFRLNGRPATLTDKLGEGDALTISQGKNDAGC